MQIAIPFSFSGIAITNTVPLTNIDQDEIKAVLSEYKLANCDVAIREPNCTADDLVDVIEGNRVYIPCIYVGPFHSIDTVNLTNFQGSEQSKAEFLLGFQQPNKAS